MISIVSPVYNAEKILPELVRKIEQELVKLGQAFEVVLVDDRSSDQSWSVLKNLAHEKKFIKAVRLSRNFGQHMALSAALKKATGDIIIVMDCDLQDDPIYFKDLLAEHAKGFDIVYTKKTSRRHGFFKNILAYAWHSIFNWLSESHSIFSNNEIGSYSLISRKVVDAYNLMADSRRHYLLLLRWLGFSASIISVEHRERFAGKSSYNFSKLLRHAISGVVSQSNRMLYLSIGLGFIFLLGSILAAVGLVFLYFWHGFKEGWASQIVLTVLCTGIILVMLGVTGTYVGMIFEQVKGRPLFIIDEEITGGQA